MKTMAVLFCALAFVVSGAAQYSTPGKTAPGAKNASTAKDAKKKDDEPGKIAGMEIPRGGDRYLGIEIIDGNFKLTFYDAKKKPTPADSPRAALRWDVKTKAGTDRVLLSQGGDPNSLTSSRTIKPPYAFKLVITLMKDGAAGDDPVGETYTIDFHQ